jgi:hypothetical protein
VIAEYDPVSVCSWLNFSRNRERLKNRPIYLIKI